MHEETRRIAREAYRHWRRQRWVIAVMILWIAICLAVAAYGFWRIFTA